MSGAALGARCQICRDNVVLVPLSAESSGSSSVPTSSRFGEIRGGEAFELLQLLNTGHSGTISTVHANTAALGISRISTCVLQSGVEIPYRAIKTNIADSLDVVVQIQRRPGLCFVSEVLALRGFELENDKYILDPVYQHDQ